MSGLAEARDGLLRAQRMVALAEDVTRRHYPEMLVIIEQLKTLTVVLKTLADQMLVNGIEPADARRVLQRALTRIAVLGSGIGRLKEMTDPPPTEETLKALCEDIRKTADRAADEVCDA